MKKMAPKKISMKKISPKKSPKANAMKKISPKKKNRESKWPSSHGQRSSTVRFPNHRSLFSEEKRLQPSKRDRRQLGRICSRRNFL